MKVLAQGNLSGFYYIANNNTNAYNAGTPATNWYMVPASNGGNASIAINRWAWNDDANTPFVTTYQCGRVDNAVWYFQKTGDYYYIIHAETGKYITYNTPVGTNSNRRAFHLQSTPDGDNSLFAITYQSGSAAPYNIRPKNITSGHRFLNPANGNKPAYYGDVNQDQGYYVGGIVGIYSNDADNGSKWFIEEATGYVPHVCPMPVIRFNNATNEVSITLGGSSETIYYTTDGTDPTSSTGTPYSAAFSCTTPNTTIKAIAACNEANIVTYIVKKVATPTIQNNGDNAISIVSATEGAEIHYTLDGSTPTSASPTYSTPLRNNVSGVTIKAIAIKEEMIYSDIAVNVVTLTCENPVILRDDATHFSITYPAFPATGVTIYYSTDGSDPTPSSTVYAGGSISFSGNPTVKAIAAATNYNNSAVVTRAMGDVVLAGSGTPESPFIIASADDFDAFREMVEYEYDVYYRITAPFTVNSGSSIATPFSGTLDGGLYTLGGLDSPLFESLNGGTVKNLILDNVSITSGVNVGAICNVADGESRIYNCGILASTASSISGSGKVGGLVGWLKGRSRVINCYSYADVAGGSDVGGLVGYNDFASTSSDLRTMVMNCLFYGNITAGTNVSPVYGGVLIPNNYESPDNTGLNNYNYYAYGKELTGSTKKYNSALAAEQRFLVRFELYRSLLNSNRELAAWYATGAVADAKVKMAKWVLDKSIAPFPVLKVQGVYPTIVNPDVVQAPDYDGSETNRNKGHKLIDRGGTGEHAGQLAVTIQMGGGGAVFGAPAGAALLSGNSSTVLYLDITDKDYDNYNFNYAKVQLPYYNDVGTGNYTGNRVVTGWKIVSIDAVAGDPYSASHYTGDNYDAPYYNFADRTSSNKDLYSVSGRVFSQGAYFDVPDGVAAITIEPYWAKCTYLSDKGYDFTYNNTYTSPTPVEVMGVRYDDNTKHSINGSSQRVFNSMKKAVDSLARNASHTVYDYAVVLVGNYHQYCGAVTMINDAKPFTVMSIDLDNDNEPDYSFIYQHTNRLSISPIRFDFLNFPGVGMAQKVNGNTQMPDHGIFRTNGWFEVTNTCLLHISQFEYDYSGKSLSPLILLGGAYEQIVSTADNTNGQTNFTRHTKYMLIGCNAWFKMFNNGVHADRDYFTPHRPVSVTGGDYEKFYLSGMFRPDAAVETDNAECYISGGRFGELASGGMEQIDGDVTWQIDGADITHFYGGGINSAKAVTGNIDVTIRNSHVDIYCGGPKFGDMGTDKTVHTQAANCVFGTYFGAGYGGTSYNRVRHENYSNKATYDFNGWCNKDYSRQYSSGNGGIATSFEYELMPYSGFANNNQVGRFYVNYASLSLATTNNVTSSLQSCVVKNNFYGGGNLGMVAGDILSTLDDCTIYGDAFGGGFSATPPTVEVMPKSVFNPEPSYDGEQGIYIAGGYPAAVTYTWKHAASVSTGHEFDETEGHYILTTADLDNLGRVNGNTTIKIVGISMVYGNVYGGGNMGEVRGNTKVIINQNK